VKHQGIVRAQRHKCRACCSRKIVCKLYKSYSSKNPKGRSATHLHGTHPHTTGKPAFHCKQTLSCLLSALCTMHSLAFLWHLFSMFLAPTSHSKHIVRPVTRAHLIMASSLMASCALESVPPLTATNIVCASTKKKDVHGFRVVLVINLAWTGHTSMVTVRQ